MITTPTVLAITALLAVICGIFAFWFGNRKGRQAEGGSFAAHMEELRSKVSDARQRELEAQSREVAKALQLATVGNELKVALEEKGKFQTEAARVEEVNKLLEAKESRIERLNDRITELEKQVAAAEANSQATARRAEELIEKEKQAQAEVFKAKDEQIEKLNEFITRAREVLSTEFKALSSDALKQASDQLLKSADSLVEKHGEKTTADVKFNQQRIEMLLKPVEETMKRLDKHVEDSDVARSKAEALLDEQVKRLAGASESLSSALRKPVVRGSWGEMTLENALENAGLEAEIDFVLQHSTDAEDGRKRTDALVNLPKGRKLIIDSKNLMESYIALMGAEDETKRTLLAEVHSKSLRSHIKSLSSKEYWRRYDGLDCVILFVPHDGMYHAAIQDEAELIRDACDKRVFVSNPMSLIPLLKAIRYVLDQERLNKNAEEIKKIGTELYAEITRFALNFGSLGDRLRSTVAAYNDALPGLDRFIVSKSRKLKQLGLAKGADAELPEEVDLEPKLFASKELRPANLEQSGLALAAAVDSSISE